MVSKGIKVDEEFTDIASGMNEDRKDFNKLLKQCLEGNIDTIFITYKDRLTRFGFGYFESILKELGTTIEVVNATKEEDFQQELIQDFVSVIHHFSMKMYSNRRKILNDTKKLLQND
jgi:predicted site-specific integrase-resolvase